MVRRLVFSGLLLAASFVAPAGAQVIALDRPGLGFYALVDSNPAPQTMAIANRAAPALTWRITSTLPGWLSVTPLTGTAPTTLTFAVASTGLAPGLHRATVVVTSNDAITPTKNIPVILSIVAPAPNQSVYAIEYKFVGYTGLLDGYPDCAVNPRGTDVLTGIVMGREDLGRDEDVTYTGTLVRLTALDICETRGKDGPGDDERAWCAATLVGTSAAKVEIEVHGEEGRGAYVHADHDGGPSTSSVTGSCESPTQMEYERDYPSGDAGGSPSGQAIDEATTGTARLYAGGRARLVVGSFVQTEPPKGDWVLRVIAKLR